MKKEILNTLMLVVWLLLAPNLPVWLSVALALVFASVALYNHMFRHE